MSSSARPPARGTALLASIIAIALPILVSVITDSIASFGSTVIVGRVAGVSALAAIGVAFAVYQLVAQTAHSASSGFAIVAAQRVGIRDADGLRHALRAGSRVVAVASVGAALLLAVVGPLTVPAFGLSGDEAALAGGLLRILALPLLISMPFSLLNFYLIAHSRARPGMIASIVGNGVNLGLTAILVPIMGVLGSPLATGVGELVSLGMIVWAVRKDGALQGVLRKPRVREVATQVRLAVPEIANNGLDYLGNVAFVAIIGLNGALAIAANQVVFEIYLIVFTAGLSLAIGTQIIVGQAIGAGDPRNADRAFRVAILFGLGVFLLVGGVIAILSGTIGQLIVPSSETVRQAMLIPLVLLVVSAPAMVIAAVSLNRLKAVGRTFEAAVINVTSIWVVQLGGSLLLVLVFGLGLTGCYLAFLFYLLTRSVWAVVAWRRKRAAPLGRVDAVESSAA